jgi:hypothetical protein
MSEPLASLFIAIIASLITPLLAKIVADLLKRKIKSKSNYIPVKIKVGHAKRAFEFEITKDSKDEDTDRIVRYLADIREIEQTPLDTEKTPSAKPVDVEEI